MKLLLTIGFVTLLASAADADLGVAATSDSGFYRVNDYVTQAGGYLRVDASGNVIKPNSAANFTPVDGGYVSDFELVKRVKSDGANYYVEFPKSGNLGSGKMAAVDASGNLSVTTCQGDFTSNNKQGVQCATMTPQNCSDFLRDFSKKGYWHNDVFNKNLANISTATDGKGLDKMSADLRSCSDAFMMLNNAGNVQEKFGLNDQHKKALSKVVSSYPVNSIGADSGVDLNSGLNKVLVRADIFRQCNVVLTEDQKKNNRATLLLPASAGNSGSK